MVREPRQRHQSRLTYSSVRTRDYVFQKLGTGGRGTSRRARRETFYLLSDQPRVKADRIREGAKTGRVGGEAAGCLAFMSLMDSSVTGEVPRERRAATALPYRASCAHSVALRMLAVIRLTVACLSRPTYNLHASAQSTSTFPSFHRANRSRRAARRDSFRLSFFFLPPRISGCWRRTHSRGTQLH